MAFDLKEYQKSYQKNRKRERIKNRLCVKCGGPLLEDNKQTCCQECRNSGKEDKIKLREHRKINRLCARCGNNLPENYDYVDCPDCKEGSRKITEKIRDKRKKQHNCTECNEKLPKEYTFNACDNCRDSSNIGCNKRRENKKKNKICVYCGKIPSRDGFISCFDCGKNYKEANERIHKNHTDKKLCSCCGKHPILTSLENRAIQGRMCEDCYIKDQAKANLGTNKDWRLLKQKLYDQNWQCAYTGKLLILGKNTGVDHIKPRSKFPELVSDVNNVQWIIREINGMKSNILEEDFLSTIKSIYEHRNLANYESTEVAQISPTQAAVQ